MKSLFLKVVGMLFIALAVYALMFRLLGGSEFAMIPWPVALLVIAIGAFLLKRSRRMNSRRRRMPDRIPPFEEGRMLMTPLRMVVILVATAAVLWGMVAVLTWGFESRHWSPPIVSMISLTASSLSMALCALIIARKRRRNRRTHA